MPVPAINCSPEVQISPDKGEDAIQSGTQALLVPEEHCWDPARAVSSSGPSTGKMWSCWMSLVEPGLACPARAVALINPFIPALPWKSFPSPKLLHQGLGFLTGSAAAGQNSS